MKNSKYSFLLLLIGALLGLTIFFLINFREVERVTSLKYEIPSKALTLSEWGDYVGGIWGTYISFLGLVATIIGAIFIYQTLVTQKKQLKLQEETETFNRISKLIIDRTSEISLQIKRFSYDESEGQGALIVLCSRMSFDETKDFSVNLSSETRLLEIEYGDFITRTHFLREEIYISMPWIEDLLAVAKKSINAESNLLLNRIIYFQFPCNVAIRVLGIGKKVLEELKIQVDSYVLDDRTKLINDERSEGLNFDDYREMLSILLDSEIEQHGKAIDVLADIYYR